MKLYIKLFTLFLLSTTISVFADSRVNIEGSSSQVIEIQPETVTGLNNIFVVQNIDGCEIVYKSSEWHNPKAYRYSNLGGGYSEEIKNVVLENPNLYIPKPEGDMGYIIEDGDFRYYFWVVNYKNHEFTISSITESTEPDCEYTRLDIEATAGPINYYTINGQQRVLSREIYVDYTTQEFNSQTAVFENTDVRKVFESLSTSVSVNPPIYCSSYFVISGDRFLRIWKEERRAESVVFQPTAVNCETDAEQAYTDSDIPSNVIGTGSSGLGGSAPSEISFYAYVTEGVLHKEWQLSRDSEFENVDFRFNQQDITYTFDQEGTYYMRFIASNADGSCEAFGDTYTISIGGSELVIPNAFSPNGDGVNDIWRVSYRSLIDFHCQIFNRNGQPIYSFDSPDGGWDGTYHGKLVKPGVYYYVIIAEGADGHKYKKSGDINIIRSNVSPSGSTGDSSGSIEMTE